MSISVRTDKGKKLQDILLSKDGEIYSLHHCWCKGKERVKDTCIPVQNIRLPAIATNW